MKESSGSSSAAISHEASNLAHQLHAEVEKICEKLDPDDPLVLKLRTSESFDRGTVLLAYAAEKHI